MKAGLEKIARDPRVASVSDETALGDGYWMALKPGFTYSDNPGQTVIHEASIAGLKRELRQVRSL